MNNKKLACIIKESVIKTLLEGRNEEKAKQKTYDVIKQHFKNAVWLKDIFNDQGANPKKLSILDYIEDTFRRDYFGTNVSDSVIRLEPIMMNIALKLGFEQNNSDDEKLQRLKSIITYIKVNYKKENFPLELNKLNIENINFEKLNDIFGKIIDQEIIKDNEIANNFDGNAQINNNYEIIEINNQFDAYEYGKYSCSNSPLCYAMNKDSWNKFTANGINKVYLILNKNWRRIPEEFGENNPYDEYGLSMIFLFINPDGNIAYSNTRWNHGTKEHISNVDHSFTKSQISILLGNVNFNSIFQPFSDEELQKKGYKPIKKILHMLKQDIPLNEIFEYIEPCNDDFIKVGLNGKLTLLNKHNKQLISNGSLWFDDIFEYGNGLYIVILNDSYSFVNKHGELLDNGNLWFDNVIYFGNFNYKVELNGKYSLLNKNGKLLYNGKIWFDFIGYFDDNFYKVKLDNKHLLIDNDGNFYDIDTKLPISNSLNNSNESTHNLKQIVTEAITQYLQNNLLR